MPRERVNRPGKSEEVNDRKKFISLHSCLFPMLLFVSCIYLYPEVHYLFPRTAYLSISSAPLFPCLFR